MALAEAVTGSGRVTQAGLVTMEEIGILVEKAQVWWGLARGERGRLI